MAEPLWGEWNEEEHGSGFCGCGVMIPAGTTECDVCEAAPHASVCPCEECDEYWTCVQNGVDPATYRRTS